MKNKLVILLIFIIFWIIFMNQEEASYGPGIYAPDIPTQNNIAANTSFSFNGYTVRMLADFEIKAKVLAREDYRFGRESELSPIDLALGWGRMSDESVISQLDITQSGRWYRWNTKKNEFPIPRSEIIVSSANMHMIPKDASVKYELDRVVKGDIIRLSGYLVRVDSQDGWHWQSSLSRNDSGAGACELIFVNSFEIETIH
jgi:hypothetical protein